MGRAKWTEEQKRRASLAHKKRWAMRRRNAGMGQGGAAATGGEGGDMRTMSMKGLLSLRRQVDQEIIARAISENP